MKKIFLFTAIVMSLIAQSCSKSTDVLITTGFNIEEAKMSFANNFNNALSTKSPNEAYYSLAGGDYTPVWEMAKANENEFIWSLEVPIISDLQIVLRNKTTEVIKAAERKLLFIKNKETHSVHSFIMVSSTAETKSSNSNFEHLGENASYSGYVMYSTLAGEFVTLSRFNNGVESTFHNTHSSEFEHQHNCDETCEEHNFGLKLEEGMGCDEFGIMLLGMGGGEYFEGICKWCGALEEYCICIPNPEPCEKCGVINCGCNLDYCDECGYMPCRCNERYCRICENIESDCTCYKILCEKCHNFEADCICEEIEELLCDNCGTYHAVGECKYVCPTCGKYLYNCKCK